MVDAIRGKKERNEETLDEKMNKKEYKKAQTQFPNLLKDTKYKKYRKHCSEKIKEENLDEISQKAKLDYLSGANAWDREAKKKQDYANYKGDREGAKKIVNARGKRLSGISLAVKKFRSAEDAGKTKNEGITYHKPPQEKLPYDAVYQHTRVGNKVVKQWMTADRKRVILHPDNVVPKDLYKKNEELDEAHKIHDKVEITKGTHKGKKAVIRSIIHGAHKTAQKRYDVDHLGGGEYDQSVHSSNEIRSLKEGLRGQLDYPGKNREMSRDEAKEKIRTGVRRALRRKEENKKQHPKADMDFGFVLRPKVNMDKINKKMDKAAVKDKDGKITHYDMTKEEKDCSCDHEKQKAKRRSNTLDWMAWSDAKKKEKKIEEGFGKKEAGEYKHVSGNQYVHPKYGKVKIDHMSGGARIHGRKIEYFVSDLPGSNYKNVPGRTKKEKKIEESLTSGSKSFMSSRHTGPGYNSKVDSEELLKQRAEANKKSAQGMLKYVKASRKKKIEEDMSIASSIGSKARSAYNSPAGKKIGSAINKSGMAVASAGTSLSGAVGSGSGPVGAGAFASAGQSIGGSGDVLPAKITTDYIAKNKNKNSSSHPKTSPGVQTTEKTK